MHHHGPPSSPCYSESEEEAVGHKQPRRYESSSIYSALDDEDAHEQSRTVGNSAKHTASSGLLARPPAAALTLKMMVDKLSEDGPLDVLLHIMVKDGKVCPMSLKHI